MANTYYNTPLSDEQIEAALTAISGLIAPENNGKVLFAENGKIVAKTVSEVSGQILTRLKTFVVAGKITAEEYEEITGEPYEA